MGRRVNLTFLYPADRIKRFLSYINTNKVMDLSTCTALDYPKYETFVINLSEEDSEIFMTNMVVWEINEDIAIELFSRLGT